MPDDIGSIIGTLIIVAFGAFVAFGVPAMMGRQDNAAEAADDIPVAKWLRILGMIVMAVGLIQVILLLIL